MKILLNNGCSYSKPSITPKNWETKSASLKVKWLITYRFYDPQFQKPKQINIKGMNSFLGLEDRQNETRRLLSHELGRLKAGYNPFYKSDSHSLRESSNGELTLIKGLKLALNGASVSETTKRDLKYAVTLFERAINFYSWQHLRLKDVSRRHIKSMLENASKSNDRFNKNRSYLMILLNVLLEEEVIDYNFARDIKKKKTVKTIRKTLSQTEREQVDVYLMENYPSFHRFLHIFYHSGSRISELIKIKESDVDLSEQRFKVIIQKGGLYKEVWKVIKDVALPYWKAVLEEASKGQFLFSKDLKPGNVCIKSYQIDKRWYRLVKKPLGIEADFYSLKHLHTTEVVDHLGNNVAAKHNSHTNTAMVTQIYDVKSKMRDDETIKTLNNPFA